MSNYKYGMYVKTIAKIKKDIIRGMIDEEIKKKWNISEGQLGFIHDVLLKKSYRNIERRVSILENKVEVFTDMNLKIGSQMYSKDEDFGVGTVIEMFKKEFDYLSFRVKFTHRRFPTLCNMDKHGKFTTSPDGNVRVLKRLS